MHKKYLAATDTDTETKTKTKTKTEIKHLKELMNLQFKYTETALVIQSTETERRLNLLNGEAERLKSIQSTYLPREVFEANYKELSIKIELLQRIVYIGIGGVLVLQIILRFM